MGVRRRQRDVDDHAGVGEAAAPLGVEDDAATEGVQRRERLGRDVAAPLGADDDRRRVLQRRARPAVDIGGGEGLTEVGQLVVALSVLLEDQAADEGLVGWANQHREPAPAQLGVQLVVAAFGDHHAADACTRECARGEDRGAAAAHLLAAIRVDDFVAHGLTKQRDHLRNAPTAR